MREFIDVYILSLGFLGSCDYSNEEKKLGVWSIRNSTAHPSGSVTARSAALAPDTGKSRFLDGRGRVFFALVLYSARGHRRSCTVVRSVMHVVLSAAFCARCGSLKDKNRSPFTWRGESM